MYLLEIRVMSFAFSLMLFLDFYVEPNFPGEAYIRKPSATPYEFTTM
jgi:hypothetical protein